jgi:hypothetical protein
VACFFNLDRGKQRNVALVTVLVTALLVIPAVAQENLSVVGQIVSKLVIENISILDVGRLYADIGRPGDAFGST